MGSKIRYVVLDFDGTCTRVEQVHARFLRAYFEELQTANPAGEPSTAEWEAALGHLRAASPKAGWTLMGAPSTAPAAADPYILAGEAAALLKRANGSLKLSDSAYSVAYTRAAAPWRDDVAATLEELVKRGLKVGFISNSSTKKIEARLDELLGAGTALRKEIAVRGDAMKFMVREIPAGDPGPAGRYRAEFDRVPKIDPAMTAAVGRPIYLRRGAYFDALCHLWSEDFHEPGFPIAQTIFCGDIWELDLALPQALGAPVHLIRRAAPYETYAYEFASVPEDQQSDELRDLLRRL